jgi:hypothetical protein
MMGEMVFFKEASQVMGGMMHHAPTVMLPDYILNLYNLPPSNI